MDTSENRTPLLPLPSHDTVYDFPSYRIRFTYFCWKKRFLISKVRRGVVGIIGVVEVVVKGLLHDSRPVVCIYQVLGTLL